MSANNEIGTVQPIAEIGKNIKSKNPDILFHTDATQAVNYLEMDIEKLGVDLLSFSGHKIYGPKGIGVLFVKSVTKIKPITFGGHHEKGLRSGTLNVPGIVGIGKAIELISTRDNSKILELRDYAWQKLQEKISDIELNGDEQNRLANNLNFSIKGVEGEAVMLALDLAGIAISTGSACSSGTLDPSHVLMSLGLSHEQAHGSLRISLGKDNTKKEVNIFIDKLSEIVDNLRKVGGDFSK
jgi:cysteine desulfurase